MVERTGPELIAHRRNTQALLAETPWSQGVEIDVRSHGDRLIVQHDPYSDGVDLELWLGGYRHGTLILNVKEEGLEERLGSLMAAAGIARFFFLDQSFPFLIRTARAGERRCAVRYSEYESAETALAVAPLIDWVWVDLFTAALPDPETLRRLQQVGLRLCLVSPELHGRPPETEVPALRRHFAGQGLALDAVCTKVPALWE